MKLSEMFLPEFAMEMAHTRKTLERVPEEKLAWKPHEKSMTLGRLAGHLAELPGLGVMGIRKDSLDFAPEGAPARKKLFQPTYYLVQSTDRLRDFID